MRIAMLLGCSVLASLAVGATPLTIVKNGKSDYKILIAPGGTPSMRHGAEELQRYIQEMSGVKLPILHPEAVGLGGTLHRYRR